MCQAEVCSVQLATTSTKCETPFVCRSARLERSCLCPRETTCLQSLRPKPHLLSHEPLLFPRRGSADSVTVRSPSPVVDCSDGSTVLGRSLSPTASSAGSTRDPASSDDAAHCSIVSSDRLAARLLLPPCPPATDDDHLRFLHRKHGGRHCGTGTGSPDGSVHLRVPRFCGDELDPESPVVALRSPSPSAAPGGSSRSPGRRSRRSSQSAPLRKVKRPEVLHIPASAPFRKVRLPDVASRPTCASGCKCQDRSKVHLAEYAHAFDGDYTGAEERTLLNFYTWVDVNGSGLVSKAELMTALPQLSVLADEQLALTHRAFEVLDEDGNGYINFSEFSYWAGPRLGLPLGVRHLFAPQGRSFGSHFLMGEGKGGRKCSILGCPCICFESKRQGRHCSAGKLLCYCGHKESAHTQPLHEEVPYPAYWRSPRVESGDFNALIRVGPAALQTFQRLFDETYSDVYTRDRKLHNPENARVPKGFKVVGALRNENARHWPEYEVCRGQLLTDCAAEKVPCYDNVRSTEAWQRHGGSLAGRLAGECNEWYLFHGTTLHAAERICHGDFAMRLAGGSTGTLYGPEAYCAESVTKADEYASPNDEDLCTMLLVRALGGKVHYTAKAVPDPEELISSCIEGPYDCVLGDRVACKGTYRQFVFFDSQNLYAEYIITYKMLWR